MTYEELDRSDPPAMDDRQAMIEAVWEVVRAEAHCTNFWHEISAWKQKTGVIIAALEPFMQAREQAVRDEGRKRERGEIVAWLRSDAAKWQHPLTDNAMAVTADIIERNEHREQQDG